MRRWTDAELDALRACYATPTQTRLGRLPVKDLARRLGRTYGACVEKASALGICRHPYTVSENGVALKRLHANGHSIREIGRRLGMSHSSIRYALAKMGIEQRGRHEQTPEEKVRWKESVGAFLERADYGSLREMVSDRELARVVARWPAATTHRQADVLDLLAEGPKTAREIAERIGTRILRAYNLLRQLRELGAVHIASRSRKGRVGKRGSLPWVYSIFPGIERGKVQKVS